MVKTRRYCKYCNEETLHDSWKYDEGLARLLLGIFTLGFNETFNPTYFKCQVCDKKTTLI